MAYCPGPAEAWRRTGYTLLTLRESQVAGKSARRVPLHPGASCSQGAGEGEGLRLDSAEPPYMSLVWCLKWGFTNTDWL